jgi:hypothetical protein
MNLDTSIGRQTHEVPTTTPFNLIIVSAASKPTFTALRLALRESTIRNSFVEVSEPNKNVVGFSDPKTNLTTLESLTLSLCLSFSLTELELQLELELEP